ncbi:alkaline phosphatase [Ammonifex thiophilus]|uniref:alkaline phosphatase n=1 Tax=Ammonifex thiophilus TaxID=444093 RepID=UPI00196A5690|nr:alkaline phosphatase [Ammonifex thiophilus]
MKRYATRVLASFLVLLLLCASFPLLPAYSKDYPVVKNVIFLIPDGMSLAGTTLARWYRGSSLAMDEMACGLVRTHSAVGPITDSAAAGTALAAGFKTNPGYVTVLPDGTPVASVLEAAKLAGKSTGLVVTCEIPHATPAVFSAHALSRKDYDTILKQQVYQGMDVVLGGGHAFMKPGARKDGEDLVEAVKALGYEYVTDPEELHKVEAGKVWGMFAPKALKPDFDRDPVREPSLAEMTAKAIEILSKNPKGFFLMVEGSQIDWAAHANDPVYLVSEILAFDEAVKVALDFAKKNKDTVVIVAADHGNGGVSIGDRATSGNYSKLPLSSFIEPLKRAKLTGVGLEEKLAPDRSNVIEAVSRYYGIADLSEEEIKAIKEAKPGKLSYVVGPMLSKRAHIGWTTNGHTGEDVVLYVYSPKGEKLTGVVDNTDIAKYIGKVLGLDLRKATQELFVPARMAFEALGAQVYWDDRNPASPVLVVSKEGVELSLPVNTNVAKLNGKTIHLNGLTVYYGTKTYVPQAAVDLFKAAWEKARASKAA